MYVCIYVCLSHAQTICFYTLALCPHCWSLHFKFCHNIFNLLSTVCHAVGMKPAICNTQSLSQDTSNPRSCGGGVYNVTTGLVDTGGEHGCVFIRRHD